MLEELKVLNGELSPKYDKYNNLYTVKVSSDVDKLDLVFKEEDLDIHVYGNNNLKVGENKIVISLTKDDIKDYIYVTAIKEEDQEVMSIEDYRSLEVANSMPVYAGPLIAFSCFLIVLTVFLFMFVSHKNK